VKEWPGYSGSGDGWGCKGGCGAREGMWRGWDTVHGMREGKGGGVVEFSSVRKMRGRVVRRGKCRVEVGWEVWR